MAVARRAAPAPAPVAVASGVNFGDLDFYAGGFTLPKGLYAMEHDVCMHAATKQDGTPLGKARLGVMLTAHPIQEDGSPVLAAEPLQQFLSMGSKADQSFAPDPATGKSLVPIPGAPSTSAPKSTNWALYLKSLYDTGLPKGIFTNDITVLDGVWVRTDLVPEPEDRKNFAKSQTGENADQPEERRGSGQVPVVTEILEGGKPWEGGGGFLAETAPAAAPKAPLARPAAVAPKPAVARPAAAPVAAPAAAADDEAVQIAASNGITEVLTVPANANGVSKLILRTSTFKAVTAAAGAEMAQAVLETYFASDDALNSVLGPLGYSVQGIAVKPV
jgi:hypothetical protein